MYVVIDFCCLLTIGMERGFSISVLREKYELKQINYAFHCQGLMTAAVS